MDINMVKIIDMDMDIFDKIYKVDIHTYGQMNVNRYL